MSGNNLNARTFVEDRFAGNQKVKGAAKAVDVRPCVRFFGIPRLFGSDVSDSANENPLFRKRSVVFVDLRLFFEAGDAQVEQFGGAVIRENDIRRLHVAVDDPLMMGFAERRGDLGDDGCRLGN